MRQYKMKRLLEMSASDARAFLLKGTSYCNFDVPPYFTFESLLKKVAKKLENKLLTDFLDVQHEAKTKKTKPKRPSNYEGVNYTLLNNKDGKYAWRPFQLIHPALYVSLVDHITKPDNWQFIRTRFGEFRNNKKIKCLSLPIESEGKQSDRAILTTYWWREVEQESIALGLEYEFLFHTDITDCYGSIYTHSVVWALHTKKTAKEKKDDASLIGNVIDWHLQAMSNGQTNGIPQGSVLMDFIAEIVLGCADLELLKKLKAKGISDFRVLRYRDDYRIFVNNPQEGEIILNQLTEVLVVLGMRLNAQKTIPSNNVVKDSVKGDKLYWIDFGRKPRNLRKRLHVLHNFANLFPNSGTLKTVLSNYFKAIERLKTTNENLRAMISIVVDIAVKNPITYPFAAQILSKLVSLLKLKKDQTGVVKKILKRFDRIPNTGHLQLWLQRMTLKIDANIKYDEQLCKKVDDSAIEIWNSDWLKRGFRNLISSTQIVDHAELDKLGSVIKPEEVDLFFYE